MANNLLFNDVEVLGYNHQNNFFGEKSLFYSSRRNISIRGYILDLTNDGGVETIFDATNRILKQNQEFQEIIINGENFGIGKVKSFSVDSETWVRYTQYQADIEILLEVPIANIDSDEFEGIDINKQLYLIKSFSESFSLNFEAQNKILGGEHSIDIEYDANNKNINLIKLAQSLATELLKTIPSNSNIAEGNYTTRNNYKVLNSENYNTVTGKCGFKKSFSYSTLNTSKNYSFIRTHSVEIDENGIATASERCSIKAEFDVPSLYENSIIGYEEQVAGVYSRCNAVFQTYKTKFNILANLNQQFINKSVQVNKVNGDINFTILFDNDPKKINSSFIWEYVSSLDRTENGVWNASENGSVKGNGKLGSDAKYTNANTGWTSAKNGIFSRVTNFYNTEATDSGGGTLKELAKVINRNKYEGFINYNYTYTNDPTIKDGSDDGIKKIDIEKSDTGLLPITKDFIIPNKKFALNQNRNLQKQGTYQVKVNMEIGCTSNNDFNSKTYFTKAKTFAGGKPSFGNDEYLESINYSSNETDKTISYEATYKYS
jgi:hypothetical protein